MQNLWQPASSPPPPSTDSDRDYGYAVESDPVLVYDSRWKRMSIAVFSRHTDPTDEQQFDGWNLDDRDSDRIYPSHWRPLPDAPKEDA